MHFIPILRKYVGSLKNPWVTEGLVRPMQIIWDGVMQDWPHTFMEDNDKIYRLVSAHPLSLPTITLFLFLFLFLFIVKEPEGGGPMLSHTDYCDYCMGVAH